MYKLDLEKQRNQIASIHWIIEKQENSRETSTSASPTKAFDCVGYNKLWKILKDMGIPDHLTSLLRNLCAGQEATELDMNNGLVQNQGRSTYVKAVYC